MSKPSIHFTVFWYMEAPIHYKPMRISEFNGTPKKTNYL